SRRVDSGGSYKFLFLSIPHRNCWINTATSVVLNMRASVNRPPTPDVLENRPEKEPTLQEIVNIKLIESGEKERLMELLRERLAECGWRDEMKALCSRAFVKKKGRNNVTVDDLVHVITPKGRASIPDSVKAELLQRIRTILVSAAL
ncbi:Transcription and mRNA export factor ENY2, partial [Quillaja saponaria]